ncbi:hypothetical protein Q3G72_032038 [Acer saccharum]|nr:hypothetical protein Q3G72_032038 [Acer saccharum]
MDSNDSTGNAILEPRDDIEFDSHEAAYSFYKDYAKSMGFGTAKLSSRRSRASKEFIDAKFSCIRYGNKQQSDDAINPRPSPKIGCKASLHVKRRQNGKWFIYSFVKEHNHELLPAQAHFFRSHRNDDPLKNDARLRRRKNLAPVSKLFSSYQNVDCLESYMRNQHDKGRNLVLEPGDAQVLLDHFMQMQDENSKFFYAVDLNEEHRLRNVFWVDSKGMEDYTNFSDVVSFDTTYFTNKYKIPLVLFIGVNHHIQPTLLGCALIADETVYTFVWLFQTWFIAMGERAPRVILTDQNDTVKAAAAAVFPDTHHCFSLWHVLEKIPRHLEYLSLWHDSFMVKFYKCIYRSWTEEQFEKRWWKLVDRFHLREVQWVQSLYGDRKHWVPTFMRGISFASLSAPSRSESLNSAFDKYVHGETLLREFIEQYKVVLEDRLNTSEFHAICGIEEENQFGSTSKDKVSNSVVINTNSNLGRAEGGKEKGSNVNNANKRGKVSQPGTFSVGTQAGYHQMGMSDMRPTQLHNFVPAQLHKVLPTMFQNVASTQFHDVATTHLPENRLPR